MILHNGKESWSSCLLLRQIQLEESWSDCDTAPESSFEAADYELCKATVYSTLKYGKLVLM